MKIGIDARLIGETGVGRYIRNLISELSLRSDENQYILFLRKREFDTFILPDNRFKKRVFDTKWHSITEQLMMPFVFGREHLDVLHVPYFNAPVFYTGKYIVTIHDLTILHFDTGKASTLPYALYKIRRFGYRMVLKAGIMRARHIISVSETVKKDILKNFTVSPSKITVAYEGIDPEFLNVKKNSDGKIPVEDKYFLYVGNVYPHKNVEMLLNAFVYYAHTSIHPAKLVFVGPSDYFYHQLQLMITSFGLDNEVVILHHISDSTLRSLYSRAIALIFPSRMEGFGLPALEALASGCRVIASDIPIFREILGAHAQFVDTTSPHSLVRAMKLLSKKPHNTQSYKKLLTPFLQKYSWKTMAEKTLHLYIQIGTPA